MAGLMDMPRHYADFALPRRDYTWTIRPDEPGRGLCPQVRPNPNHVVHRNAFRDADDQRETGVRRLHNCVRRKWRRHEDNGSIRAGGFDCLLHGIKNRKPQMFLPAFPRGCSAHHFGSVVNRLLRVKRAFPSGEALKENSCVFVYKHAHCASLTAFSAASFMPSATVKLNPDSVRIFR